MTKEYTGSRDWQLKPDALLPALIGAGVGALGAFGANRKSRAALIGGGLFGAAVALAMWSPRRRVQALAHGMKRGVNTTRDRYWLARHPIDYA